MVLGVASPAKFSDVVKKAGLEWTGRDIVSELEGKPSRSTDWEKTDDWYAKLRNIVELIGDKYINGNN